MRQADRMNKLRIKIEEMGDCRWSMHRECYIGTRQKAEHKPQTMLERWMACQSREIKSVQYHRSLLSLGTYSTLSAIHHSACFDRLGFRFQ